MGIISSKYRYTIYLCCSLLCAFISVIDDQYGLGILDYIICFVLIITTFLTTRVTIPKSFLLLIFTYFITVVISAYLSPYTMGLKFVLLGTIITIIPFLIFLISYNYRFSLKTLDSLIDSWIYFIISLTIIAFVETLLFSSNMYSQEALLKSYIVKPGFFASLCNQGVILSLYRFRCSSNPSYKKYAIYLSICALLSLQLKVFCGLVIIWGLFFIIFSSKNKSKLVIPVILVCLLCVASIYFITPLYDKIIKYISLYGAVDSYENVARPALYYQSFNIANDFAPFGSGQGTFGSVPVNMRYNKIYYDYNLYYIHGLGETGDNFKMDTHWASILGENGYFGSLIYFILYLYPLFYIRRLVNSSYYKSVKYLFFTIFIVISFESITLCIPGRMAFIFIYSGILGLICRQIVSGAYDDDLNS